MHIPFIDLKREYLFFKKDIAKVIKKISLSADYILGKEVEKFEKEFAAFLKVRYAVGVNSGTDALVLALKALGVKEGDEIITTPFSFVSTASAILLVGAKPVFVDIDYHSLNIDPKNIKQALTKKVKGIILVHLYGNPCEMDEILEIKNRSGLFLIEDCAQAFGSLYKDRYCGTFGEIGCFSFYPTKNLSCFGDGGMCVTNSFYLQEKIRALRNHGTVASKPTSPLIFKCLGLNSRLDSLQAGILSVKLKKIEYLLKKRREIAQIYNQKLFPLIPEKPEREEKKVHTYNIYTIKVSNNFLAQKYLQKRGIETKIYYLLPLHKQPIFRKNSKFNFLTNAEKAAREVLSIPCYPFLKKTEIKKIVGAIKEAKDILLNY